jgi:tetratricopeptide (TPR) repeat protein
MAVTGGQGVQGGSGNVQHNTFNNITQQAPPAPPPAHVVAGNIPQAPLAFQPRDDLMARLRAAGPGVSVVRAVTGMRGVGKTQLAAAHARACIDAGWRLVAWVNAEDAPSVLRDLAVVAGRLGAGRPGETLEGIARAVRNRLEADGDQCLIVFDNVTDFAVIEPYVPALGSSQVVVTSTGAGLPVPRKPLTVDVFSDDEALAFLAERTGRDEPEQAHLLATELGCLPLALAQAASVISAQRLTYPVYLDRLRASPARKYLLPPRDDPYPSGVADAILLSVDAVTTTDPTGRCAALLGIVSVLSAEGVSRDLLHVAGAEGFLTEGRPKGIRRALRGARGRASAAETDAALGRLADASLLSFSADAATIVTHRLVTRVIRDRASRDGTLGALGARAVRLIGAHPVGEPWEDRAKTLDSIRQVTALHDHFASLPAAEQPRGLLDLRGWAFSLLLRLDDSPAQAIELGESLVADRTKVLGAGHADSLLARSNLAEAYRAAGRLGDVIALLRVTLAAQVRVIGADHPHALTSLSNLASAYNEAGRPADAIPLCERALASRVRVLGADHPDTLSTRNNLASAYENAGRLDEAIPLYERTLADFRRVRGADHRDTLLALGNLASAYQRAGRPDDAVTLQERVLDGYLRVRGADHRDTLLALNNLAGAYETSGRPDEAAELFQRALTGFERLLGPGHPTTVIVRGNLAHVRKNAARPGTDPADLG